MQQNKPPVFGLSRRAWALFALLLAGALLSELGAHHHAVFGLEGRFWFYAWFGFLSSAGLVLLGNVLGWLIKRPDNYYDDRAE